MTDRELALLRRAGKDPIAFDPRPLAEIMNDCIPYERWERELRIVQRAGYRNRIDALKAKRNAKNKASNDKR